LISLLIAVFAHTGVRDKALLVLEFQIKIAQPAICLAQGASGDTGGGF
jgi:hypothetical protein